MNHDKLQRMKQHSVTNSYFASSRNSKAKTQANGDIKHSMKYNKRQLSIENNSTENDEAIWDTDNVLSQSISKDVVIVDQLNGTSNVFGSQRGSV